MERIKIRLTADELYTAEILSVGYVNRWTSPHPMTTKQLIAALRDLGCHQTDIGDAFYEADPDWLRRDRPDDAS